MTPLVRVEGRAYPLGRENVDTDTIIPADYMKSGRRDGLAKGAFASIRREPDNVFDDPAYSGAPILVAGENFGCGSSREHAAWAIAEIGVRVVVAPSFSDIFASNAYKNGILPAQVDEADLGPLLAGSQQGWVTVDLENQRIETSHGFSTGFQIDPYRRQALLEGRDEIDLILTHLPEIEAFEERMANERQWLQPYGTVAPAHQLQASRVS